MIVAKLFEMDSLAKIWIYVDVLWHAGEPEMIEVQKVLPWQSVKPTS
jgi:hypothetical protein